MCAEQARAEHKPLPVDALIPKISQSLRSNPNLVLQAAPGAGKTTRVPPLLLDIVAGEILVLEPRRMAARMAARRVAWEMGEAPGQTVGYQVRFEEEVSKHTRIRFVTEGVLARRMVTDPRLSGVGAVVLDEFHERHLDGDLALALLKRLQQSRPELRIVVMSATLDAKPVAEFLGGCPVLQSEGRLFPVTLQHTPYSPDPLEQQVQRALAGLLKDGERGHVLVFLPGAAEIRRAMRACEATAHNRGLVLLPLHGDLSPAEQDRAVAPSANQKVIFATNVAESSLTVDGVTAVIDSGLARIAEHSVWSGFPVLRVGRISKASAQQRAGRAGRTAPGRVVRLYPEEDYARRREFDLPEILRSDLSQLCLTLRSIGVEQVTEFAWLDAPPKEAIASAESLLNAIGAIGGRARELARYPLPPRLARVVVEALARGVGDFACRAVALLSAGVRLQKTDLLDALDVNDDPRTRQHMAQLRRIAGHPRDTQKDEDALLISLLSGFPDHVARRRGERQLLVSNGRPAELAGEAVPYEFLVAVDAEERSDRAQPVVRVTSRIEPDWLLDLFPDRVEERTLLDWNVSAQRVESVTEMRYGQLVLQEWRDPKPEANAEIGRLLASKAMESGVAAFVNAEDLSTLQQRMLFAGMDVPDVQGALVELCSGLRSFAELRASADGLLQILEARAGAARLRELAPVAIKLKGGRQVKVHYEAGRPPWIQSRLQDFFGMREAPCIGPQRTPVVVHLLAPNGRAVQTTTDLPGFWSHLYPQVRRELMRRYPRHSWPENV